MHTVEPIFSVEVTDPDLRSVREVRHALRSALSDTDIPPRLAQDLLLAVQEHATNAVTHGDPPPSTIKVWITALGASWSLHIRDDGGPFTDFDALMALATLGDLRREPRTGGMGLQFIGTRFSDYEYAAGFGGGDPNVLSLHFPPRADNVTRPMVVLLEDELLTRLLIKSTLQPEFKVVDFDLPTRALRLIRRHQPDLILCDIGLPEMDGIEFRQELAKEIDTDIVPFVFLSAHDDDATVSRAGDLGIDDFIPKPPHPATLLRVSRRLITRSRRVREALIAKSAKDLSSGLQSAVPQMFGPFRIGHATESATVGGGDLIQAGTLGSRLILLIADVMGHGVAARFYAHGIAAYFRSLILGADRGDGPDRLMTGLSNALLADPTYRQTIASAQIVDLRPDGSVGVCSAGHPFPVMDAGGTLRWIEISGPLLALAPDLQFSVLDVDIADGDRLVLYTDGLSETDAVRRDPAAAGRRLFDLLASNGDLRTGRFAKSVMARHRADAGGLSDDTSLLVVERGGTTA